ncbi:MAG: hypothetical protein IJS90_08015 [Clostridia bacterium]|nr:hypothetical protein [Clostridia bacterium]
MIDQFKELWSQYIFTPETGKVSIVLAILSIAGMWLLFRKAGKGGWRSLIPVLNIYTLVQIADRGWKVILFFIPLVGAVYYIIFSVRLARAFGKGGLFALGLMICPPLFMLILGFGKADYRR